MGTVHRMGLPGCPDCDGRGFVRTRDDEGLPQRETCDCTMTATERAQYQRSLEAILARSLEDAR